MILTLSISTNTPKRNRMIKIMNELLKLTLKITILMMMRTCHSKTPRRLSSTYMLSKMITCLKWTTCRLMTRLLNKSSSIQKEKLLRCKLKLPRPKPIFLSNKRSSIRSNNVTTTIYKLKARLTLEVARDCRTSLQVLFLVEVSLTLKLKSKPQASLLEVNSLRHSCPLRRRNNLPSRSTCSRISILLAKLVKLFHALSS